MVEDRGKNIETGKNTGVKIIIIDLGPVLSRCN
jgi:hypothetical protein